jgi:hypothetical protein
MEIESAPEPLPLACSTCCEPLTWVYPLHLKRWIAVIPLRDVDRYSFRLHTCALKPERTWRHVQRVPPELTLRGAKRARAALAAKAKKHTEKES